MSKPGWRIEKARRVEQVLRRLPKPLLAGLRAAIVDRAQDPRRLGSRKLVAMKTFTGCGLETGASRMRGKMKSCLTLIVEVSPRGGADRTRLTGGREAPTVSPPWRR